MSVFASSGHNIGGHGPVFIKKNDEVLCRMQITIGNSDSDGFGADTNGCTAVAEMTPEDSVRVTEDSGNPAFISATYGGGFVGHMIQLYC